MRRIELLIGTMMGIAIGLGPVPAEAQTGACCNSGGACTMTDEAGCSTSGTFLGAGTDCSGVDCSGVLGACCVGTGCIPDLSSSQCSQAGGAFLGYGTTCTLGATCSLGAGACCFGGTCADFPLPLCDSIAGDYAGNGTFCAMMPDPCNPPLRGACCFPDACISGTTAAGCTDATGSYQGDGTDCGSITCTGVCGDNVVQASQGEVCDGTDDAACGSCNSCFPPGHPDECTCMPSPVCGNNLVEECEQCDGTDDSTCPGECDSMTCTCPLPVFAIKWHSVHGGGVVSVGGTMKLLGAIGQADAGVATGGTYELSGGFLGGASSAPLPATPTAVPTYPHGAVKQRYISFAPQGSHTASAFRVKDVGSGAQYYISTPRTTPASVVGQGLTFVVSDASPIINDWTSLTRIHVGGCMIAPGDNAASSTGRAYEVTATTDGSSFSAPLTVFTAARPTAANARFWADVVGLFSAGGDGSTTPPTPANSWTPPNRNVSGFDISATLQAVSAAPTAPHFTWVDVNPEPTDRVVIGPDVLRVVNAFSVGSGKEFYPYAYPQTPTTIHAPTPPSPALCPTPPLMAELNP